MDKIIDGGTKDIITTRLEDYLTSTGRDTKKPFKCISGTHPDNHPSMSFNRKNNRVKCFSCGASYDIFDLIGIDYRLENFKDQYYKACEIYHLYSGVHPTMLPDRKTKLPPEPKPPVDYTEFFLQAHKNIEKTEYHRGLSKETLDRFNIGFIEEWRHPEVPEEVPTTPRLIIPTSKESYIARLAKDEATLSDTEKRYKKMKVGNVHTFNLEALKTATQPIYVVEGEIDALSIIDVGGEAIGLGSITQVKNFLKEAEQARPKQPIIVALDNEENVKPQVAVAVKDLIKGLEELNIKTYKLNVFGDCKDANEALLKDREAFKAEVLAGEEIETEAERAEREAYLATTAEAGLADFMEASFKDNPPIPTGFYQLDDCLSGGLYAGLYVLGAISTIGKTSLMLQICDQIAKGQEGEDGTSGHDVLLFSLEMAKNELISKSLSRHTFITDVIRHEHAKTATQLRNRACWGKFTEEDYKVFNIALNAYYKYARNIYIQEGVGDIGVKEIRKTIEKHIYFTGRTPVVFIDYLQILAPYNERYTDKQNTDKNILELKRISRDFNTPVFVVSSFNRASYNADVAMEAFKESGAIEYSADVLLGLQFADKEKGKDEAFQAVVRELELKILKNRNGIANGKVNIDYRPAFNYLTEVVE